MTEKLYRRVIVPLEANQMRADRCLSLVFTTWSRSALAQGLKLGQVISHDGRTLRPASIVREGQVLRVFIPGLAPTSPPPFPPLIYEDDDIVVINKPPGLVVHPAGSNFVWSVIALAKLRWPHLNMDLAHRLDRDTSGILVLTKNRDTNQHLKKAFREGDVDKRYIGMCRGEIAWSERDISYPLGPSQGALRVKQAIRPDGLSAHTHVRVLERRAGFSLIECQITTGRNHQIRAHLEAAGYPLVGDRVYGVPPEVFLHSLKHGTDDFVRRATGAPRHALHCTRMVVPSRTNTKIILESELHPDILSWWSHPNLLPHGDRNVALST